MNEPQTPSDRTAWVRERAKVRGMTVADCARYIKALRDDYRGMASSQPVPTSLGFGVVRPPAEVVGDADARLCAKLGVREPYGWETERGFS